MRHHREVELPDENPTFGLLLCKSAKKTVVVITLPKAAVEGAVAAEARRMDYPCEPVV